MIRATVKVKNDQRSLTEQFEIDVLLLDPSSEVVQSWCKKVIADFGEPVEEVIIKTKMVL